MHLHTYKSESERSFRTPVSISPMCSSASYIEPTSQILFERPKPASPTTLVLKPQFLGSMNSVLLHTYRPVGKGLGKDGKGWTYSSTKIGGHAQDYIRFVDQPSWEEKTDEGCLDFTCWLDPRHRFGGLSALFWGGCMEKKWQLDAAQDEYLAYSRYLRHFLRPVWASEEPAKLPGLTSSHNSCIASSLHSPESSDLLCVAPTLVPAHGELETGPSVAATASLLINACTTSALGYSLYQRYHTLPVKAKTDSCGAVATSAPNTGVFEEQELYDILFERGAGSASAGESLGEDNMYQIDKEMILDKETLCFEEQAPVVISHMDAPTQMSGRAKWDALVNAAPPWSQLHRYTFIKELNKGGAQSTGIVLVQRKSSPQKYFVLKESELLDEAMNEARLLSKLGRQSSNIVQLSDFFLETIGHRTIVFLELEYCEGGDLRRYLQQHGALQPFLALQIFIAFLRGLKCLHTAGIVHRDLKPSNILLGRHGHAKLADLGVSTQLTASHAATIHAAGSIPYMAPEVSRFLMGDPISYNQKADIWSAGIIFHSMLTGRPEPHAALNNPVTFITNVEKRFGKEFASILGRCLMPNPEFRADVFELINLCQKALELFQFRNCWSIQHAETTQQENKSRL